MPYSPDHKESLDLSIPYDLLNKLSKNWECLDISDQIMKMQEIFAIAKSRGMEKNDFCELATNTLNIPLTVAKLFVDSLQPNEDQIIEPLISPKNERVINVLRITIKPNGEINPSKLRTAFWIAQKDNMTKKEFMVLSAMILDCHPRTIGYILDNGQSPESPVIPIKSETDLSLKPKNHLPKQPCAENPNPNQTKLKHTPHTHKSKPIISKALKEKENYVALALKNGWDSLNHYECMNAVKKMINRLRINFPLPLAISMSAKKLNRSEDLIATYYHLANIRNDILKLLEEELIDVHTAIQIESVLVDSKNINTKKLFADLFTQDQFITTKVFRETLQSCFKKKPKNWRNRVTICRIKPNWTKEGEVLNEYEMTYIPFPLLTDEEKKRFNFTGHKEEAYVTFQIMGRDRYAKVPIEALEPVVPKKSSTFDQPIP